MKYTHKSKKQISILMVLNHLPYGYLLFYLRINMQFVQM
nr:MAG TPA: hypothetical protein [Caudoviricetes sp.]